MAEDTSDNGPHNAWIPIETWIPIASALENVTDVVQLSRVCKLAHAATQNLSSWEGVAQEYQISHEKTQRLLELFSQSKGENEINLGSLKIKPDYVHPERSICSKFIYLEPSEIKKFIQTREKTSPSGDKVMHNYIKIKDYIQLEVENETTEELLREEFSESSGKVTFMTSLLDLEKIFPGIDLDEVEKLNAPIRDFLDKSEEETESEEDMV